jgi:hypothetical protein
VDPPAGSSFATASASSVELGAVDAFAGPLLTEDGAADGPAASVAGEADLPDAVARVVLEPDGPFVGVAASLDGAGGASFAAAGLLFGPAGAPARPDGGAIDEERSEIGPADGTDAENRAPIHADAR